MAEDTQKEQVKNILRVKLNEEKVKLWLPPFTDPDAKTGHIPQARD